MLYRWLENKTFGVKSLLREIANTFLIRNKARTFEGLKSTEKLVKNTLDRIFFESKIILNFLTHYYTVTP